MRLFKKLSFEILLPLVFLASAINIIIGSVDLSRDTFFVVSLLIVIASYNESKK